MNTRKLQLLVAVTLVVILLLLSPFLARWGTTKEIAKWSSTNAVYGVKRPIWLSIQKDVAYVDIFSLYPTWRLFITDGGYAYVRNFDIPSTDPSGYLRGCQVTWKTEGVELLTPDGEKIFIPAKLILGQIGTD